MFSKIVLFICLMLNLLFIWFIQIDWHVPVFFLMVNNKNFDQHWNIFHFHVCPLPNKVWQNNFNQTHKVNWHWLNNNNNQNIQRIKSKTDNRTQEMPIDLEVFVRFHFQMLKLIFRMFVCREFVYVLSGNW